MYHAHAPEPCFPLESTYGVALVLAHQRDPKATEFGADGPWPDINSIHSWVKLKETLRCFPYFPIHICLLILNVELQLLFNVFCKACNLESPLVSQWKHCSWYLLPILGQPWSHCFWPILLVPIAFVFVFDTVIPQGVPLFSLCVFLITLAAKQPVMTQPWEVKLPNLQHVFSL